MQKYARAWFGLFLLALTVSVFSSTATRPVLVPVAFHDLAPASVPVAAPSEVDLERLSYFGAFGGAYASQ